MMTFRNFVTKFLIIVFITCSLCFKENFSYEIKLVNVVFRHGDRTPEFIYPNFIDVDQNYYPEGLAGLTNKGKLRAHQFGELLRLMYNDFLGTTYIPEEIYTRSTDFLRTRMTLQLVLAGLYPPNSLQKWNSHLNWQPIVTDYVPQEQDILLNRVYICKSVEEEHNRILNHPNVIKRIKSYKNLTKELTSLSGINITTPRDIFTLYCDLLSLKHLEHDLPSWIDKYLQNKQFLEAGLKRLEFVNYNKIIQRLNSGPLVRKIIEDMKVTISGTMEKRQKIFLYSSHDINVYSLLAALNVVVPHVPEFTSAVIIELLHMDKKYFVKILHYLGEPSEVQELTIPNCTSPCLFEKFLELTKNIIPSDEEINCM
ncbi:venom acid phosphatase Acph-1-like [Leptopilina heterotoma]|uniref:venom acid phosphatase Acph-1-like n=1 Tax=Leptopilina heterotoma TaxID=63436 RepID=UPI001CA85A97|nr:venom acid phosphatase Acph-1-like [Leptopilina heterotoma]